MISVCSKCGNIGRSGKSSCCGRGGSWFGNCGSADNTKVEHRWYEGLEACKTRTQLKTVSGVESNAGEQRNTHNDVGIENSKAVIVAAKIFKLVSTNTSRLISVTNQPIGAPCSAVMPNKSSTKLYSGTETSKTVSIIYTSIKVPRGHTSLPNTSLSTLLSPATHTNVLTTATPTTISVNVTVVHHETIIADWISQGMLYTSFIWIIVNSYHCTCVLT